MKYRKINERKIILKRENWTHHTTTEKNPCALTSSSLFSRMSWLSVRMQYFLCQTLGSLKGNWPHENRWLGGPFTSAHKSQKIYLSEVKHWLWTRNPPTAALISKVMLQDQHWTLSLKFKLRQQEQNDNEATSSYNQLKTDTARQRHHWGMEMKEKNVGEWM